MLNHAVTFNVGSDKVCSPAIFEIYTKDIWIDKDIWIVVTDYYMYFFPIMLFLLAAILQLINFTASYYLVY